MLHHLELRLFSMLQNSRIKLQFDVPRLLLEQAGAGS